MTAMKPNILYIMSDDHAANAISAYGSRLASVFRTPNLDRLADEGALSVAQLCAPDFVLFVSLSLSKCSPALTAVR